MYHVTVIRPHTRSNFAQMQDFRNRLRKRGFIIWNRDDLERGSERWWQTFEKTLPQCDAVIVLMTPAAKTDMQYQRELTYVLEQNQPLIPVLWDGTSQNAIPSSLQNTPFVDMSDEAAYTIGLEQIIRKFYHRVFPATDAYAVNRVLHRIATDLAGVRSIRCVRVDGLSTHWMSYGVSPSVPEEDRIAPMTAAGLSLSERIAQEIGLGRFTFTAIMGENLSYVLLNDAFSRDGVSYVMVLLLEGNPPIDPIRAYFEESSVLADIQSSVDSQ